MPGLEEQGEGLSNIVMFAVVRDTRPRDVSVVIHYSVVRTIEARCNVRSARRRRTTCATTTGSSSTRGTPESSQERTRYASSSSLSCQRSGPGEGDDASDGTVTGPAARLLPDAAAEPRAWAMLASARAAQPVSYSTPTARRPAWTAPTRVVPIPHIGSNTRSPGRV